jgi:hypothetical protein
MKGDGDGEEPWAGTNSQSAALAGVQALERARATDFAPRNHALNPRKEFLWQLQRLETE